VRDSFAASEKGRAQPFRGWPVSIGMGAPSVRGPWDLNDFVWFRGVLCRREEIRSTRKREPASA
jgi:hypothetical protein